MENTVPIQKTKVLRVKLDLDKGKAFEDQCKNENTNINAKLKELIDSSLKGQKSHFVSGANLIKYDKLKNNFSWHAMLDNGKKIDILDNLSDNFLKNLKHEIDHAIQERNDWVHNKSGDSSVHIPRKILGEDDE